MEDIVDQLINILFNETIDIGSRDDAAMDLADYFQDDRALLALVKMGEDSDADGMIAASCGESLAEIMVEQKLCRKELIAKLANTAKRNAIGYIRDCKPEWIKEYKLDELLG